MKNYGYLPAPIYDPEGVGAIIHPEYEIPPVGGIQFDLTIVQKFAETLLFVRNIRGIKGNPLVRYNGGSWTSTTSKTYTENVTATIDVRGEDDTEYTSRQESIAVDSQPTTAFYLTKHIDYGNNSVNTINNTNDPVEYMLEGFDMTWRPNMIYQAGETRYIYQNVPNGNYIAWVRFPGDLNPANWGRLPFTK
ncbi:hypothetical protein GCM10027347_44700 [Larkinella harenae]